MVEVTGASVPGCFALRALLDVLGRGAASDMEASAGDAADEAARDWDARRTLLFFLCGLPPLFPFSLSWLPPSLEFWIPSTLQPLKPWSLWDPFWTLSPLHVSWQQPWVTTFEVSFPFADPVLRTWGLRG